MATGPEHYAEAERILDHAEEHAEKYDTDWYLAAVGAAQAHALLAVAAASAAEVIRGSNHLAHDRGWRYVAGFPEPPSPWDRPAAEPGDGDR